MKVALSTCHACVTLGLFVYGEQNNQYNSKIFSQSARGYNSALGLQISFHSVDFSAYTNGWSTDKWEALQFSVTIRPRKARVLKGNVHTRNFYNGSKQCESIRYSSWLHAELEYNISFYVQWWELGEKIMKRWEYTVNRDFSRYCSNNCQAVHMGGSRGSNTSRKQCQ